MVRVALTLGAVRLIVVDLRWSYFDLDETSLKAVEALP